MSAAKIMMKPLAPATNTSARNILAAAGGGGNHHHWTPVARATMSAFGHRASSVSSGASSDGGSGSGSMVPEKPKRKRQRLDHLTQEEKIMRRKLKNRMAAQSARDRKKMKMQDLEGESKELRKANEMLTKRNALLTKRVRLLELENEALRGQLLGADMVPATVAASAADSDSAEENMLQLMASFAQEAKHQHDDEEEYDDEDEDEEMMDAKEDEDDDEEQWSDAEEDLLHRQMISGGEMMMEGNESDNSSDVSDDSGLVLTTAAAAPTASVDSTSAAKSSAKSKAAAGSRVPPLEPQGRSRVAVAASQSIESAAGSGLPGSGVQARTTKGATAAGAAAGGRRRRGGCRGGRGGVPEVEVRQQRQQQQSGALHGHHLNVLNGAVQQQQPKQQHQLPRGGGGGLSAANQQQQQQQQQGCLTTVGAAAEEQLLLNDLNIAPSEIDELLDSLVQSYDEQSFLQYGCAGGVAADIEAAVSDAFCFGEQTNYSSSSTDGDEAAAEADAAPFDPDSLLNSFPLGAVSGSVQQLFASIDESTLEFTAGGGGSQSGGRQSGLLASSLALGGAATGAKGAGAASAARSLNIGSSSSSNDSRSSSPEFRHGSLHVDHDYAATLIKVVSPTADLNNNNLDLLDSLLTSTSTNTSFPVSPLSSSSLADIGYESGVASPVGSDGGISNCNNNNSNGCFGGSPLLSSSTGSAGLLFDHQDQASIDEQEMMKLMDDLTEDRLFGDGFIGSGLASSSLMASDPMLIDATFLERYPEMF